MSKLVVDAFTEVVNLVDTAYTAGDVYSMYGHRKEINKRLLTKNKDRVFKYTKYPLIALNMPFSEDVQEDGLINVSLNIAIMNYTDKNMNSNERYLSSFINTLEPLYELFIKALGDSGKFINMDYTHTRVDRLFWGNETQDNYTFTDPLDAIELIDLNLILKNNKC